MRSCRLNPLSLTFALVVAVGCAGGPEPTVPQDGGSDQAHAGDMAVKAPPAQGSSVTLVQLGMLLFWPANEFAGPVSLTKTKPTANEIAPWVAPVPGTLANFAVQAVGATTSRTYLTIYQSHGGDTLAYSATSAELFVPSGGKSGNDLSHKLSLSRGDCIVTRTDQDWDTVGGLVLTAEFVPAPPGPSSP